MLANCKKMMQMNIQPKSKKNVQPRSVEPADVKLPVKQPMSTNIEPYIISIDYIKPGLYLGNGNAARDLKTLKNYKINHILTIDNCPLHRYSEFKTVITGYKHIRLSDLPSEDLLSHFDETDEFIRLALKNGSILVHCHGGVSRSASVVLAHIMKSDRLTYVQAYNEVKSKRSVICPNRGFVTQLELYREMGYKIDPNHLKFKVYRLQKAAEMVRNVKILPQDYFDLIKVDPGLTQAQPEPNVYRCKKCRRVVAAESNLITHHDRQVNGRVICRKTFFIEPMAWMNNITNLTEGKLHCPKCNTRLGSFSWVMGTQCPCGCNVAPSFYLVPSKVDWCNVVKNVEVTV